jgi:hypothetical protein
VKRARSDYYFVGPSSPGSLIVLRQPLPIFQIGAKSMRTLAAISLRRMEGKHRLSGHSNCDEFAEQGCVHRESVGHPCTDT